MTYHKIGVTGSRHGVSSAPYCAGVRLFGVLDHGALGVPELHHGDCVGADEVWNIYAHHLGWWTVAHPPIITRYRSSGWSDEYREPKEYLDRNRDIVDQVEILIAFPNEVSQSRFGGTWYTVRYARRVGRPLVIVGPDGTVTEERCSLSGKLDG